MHEIAVPFIVVIGPTIFVLVLEFVSDEIRKTIWWRIGVTVFGVSLSLLTLWQLTSERRTAAKDRESAITETSTRVSTDVTRAVTQQYAGMVADQQKKIDALQAKLDAQGKDVAVIKGSNIVTGKGPIPVKVMNPNSPPSSETLPNLRWTQEESAPLPNSTHPRTAVAFQIDGLLNLPGFIAVCDHPCKVVSGIVQQGMSQGTLITYGPNLAGFLFNTPRPLTSGVQCLMTVESLDDKLIKVTSFRILRESEIPMTLK
jgi:hypothetical protein